MANFEKAYSVTDKHEGGYQNLKKDSGNMNSRGEYVGTNFGIAAKTYEKHIGRVPSVSDMVNMPKATAKEIYKSKYWYAPRLDKIKSQAIANQLYDTNVNGGMINVLKRVGIESGSVLSNKVIAKINNSDAVKLNNNIVEARVARYKTLKSYNAFGKTWLERAKSFLIDKETIKWGASIALLAGAIALAYYYQKKYNN